MSDNRKKRAVLALGYFDSVHVGHQAVIGNAVKIAKELCAITVVVSFEGNLRAIFSDGQERTVFNALERKQFITSLGVDEIFFAPVSKEFLSMDKNEFIDFLNNKYEVLCYVSGEDYKFGKFGKGTVADLKEYAAIHAQNCITVSTENYDFKRISTTAVKHYLTNGDISTANNLLGRKYSITGVVFSDRKVGGLIGFPTINIKIDSDRHRLKDGVYSGTIIINEKTYKAVINYGARPTFDLNEKLVEAHILDFEGELYGQKVTLFFDGFLRDVVKFDDVEALKDQIKKDIQKVRETL